MDGLLERETERLKRSWQRHEPEHLGGYLVGDVEDPRINVQSILTRHFLVEALFGARFGRLMEQELCFAAAMNWILRRVSDLGEAGTRAALLHALRRGADNAEGLEIPPFLKQLFAELSAICGDDSAPNYIEQFCAEGKGPAVLDTFQALWSRALIREAPQAIRVLEPACGSANDYRFMAGYGLARLMDYTGFDLCESNVANARALFPDVCFEVGNIFEIPGADGEFDFGFVHDLFEHLSPEALPVAVRELCRVTGRGLSVGFFQMAEIPDHIVRPVDEYHWNTLSLERTRNLFEAQGFKVHALHIGTYLHARTGCAETHNPNAYTFVACRR